MLRNPYINRYTIKNNRYLENVSIRMLISKAPTQKLGLICYRIIFLRKFKTSEMCNSTDNQTALTFLIYILLYVHYMISK